MYIMISDMPLCFQCPVYGATGRAKLPCTHVHSIFFRRILQVKYAIIDSAMNHEFNTSVAPCKTTLPCSINTPYDPEGPAIL